MLGLLSAPECSDFDDGEDMKLKAMEPRCWWNELYLDLK